MGVYYPVLYGLDKKDPNLLAGHPQTVRSDEWLVNTQLTIAQSTAGYPAINHNVHGGTDMSVAGDVPYKDWSAVFRPQNLVFFVLPLAYAFAFKWWLLLYLTIISCYFVILRFLPGKKLLAVVLSTAIGCSPFIFWWYITSALAPIFYGFFIILLGLRVINNEKARFLKKQKIAYSQALYLIGLSYLLISFALILYPPYQIPIALGVTALLAGKILDRYGFSKSLLSRESLSRVGVFLGSFILTGLVLMLFMSSHSIAINSVRHTVYPGSREVIGGNTSLFQIFSTYLQPQLERVDRGIYYYANQSEASNFFLFLPFLLIPGFALIYLEYRQKHKLNWSLLLIQLVGILFMLNLLVSAAQPVYRLFALNKVPHDRLVIGLGFAGLLQLMLIMQSLKSVRIPKSRLSWGSAIYCFLCLVVLGWAGEYVRSHYPRFVHQPLLIASLALVFAGILFCFLARRFLLAAILLLVFSAYSIYDVQPLYRGLEPLYNSRLAQTINTVSEPGDTWVTLDSIYFENIAMTGDRNSISGVQSYPNTALWQQVEGPKGNFIYNRYAHVLFSSDPSVKDKLHLLQADNFYVKFDCSFFIKRNVQYSLATHPLNERCLTPAGQVNYPAATFYIYRVD